MNKPRSFISYSELDGLDFAERIRNYFRGMGLDTWMYRSNFTVGALTWKEIGTEIRDRDIAIVIITKGSHNSIGQERECNIINHYAKPTYVLKAADTIILPELSWANWVVFTNANFDEECVRAAIEINRTIQHHRRLLRQKAKKQ